MSLHSEVSPIFLPGFPTILYARFSIPGLICLSGGFIMLYTNNPYTNLRRYVHPWLTCGSTHSCGFRAVGFGDSLTDPRIMLCYFLMRRLLVECFKLFILYPTRPVCL